MGPEKRALEIDGGRHEEWMAVALEEAERAAVEGEVPVGAVLVRGGEILARAHNLREATGDPTAHAEVLALVAGSKVAGNWRLEECDLYVTLEPCAMCAGALVNARIRTLIFGTSDPKGGYCGSLGDIVRDSRLNHRVHVISGVRAEECAQVLRRFFARLRDAPSGP